MNGPPNGLLGISRQREGWTVADVFGEIDFSRSRELRESLSAFVRASARLILNLSNVHWMDSTALATLVAARRQLAENRGRLRLCCLNPRVRSLIEITQLNRVFEIFGTEEEAAAAV
jgi:anti-anti-sigma factor